MCSSESPSKTPKPIAISIGYSILKGQLGCTSLPVADKDFSLQKIPKLKNRHRIGLENFRMKQKIVNIVLIVVIIVLIGEYFFLPKNSSKTYESVNPKENFFLASSRKTDDLNPKIEIKKYPSEWKTYEHVNPPKFEIKYPSDWSFYEHETLEHGGFPVIL